MMLRPYILQYIINFPRSRRSSRRRLDDAQTVYFTIYYQLFYAQQGGHTGWRSRLQHTRCPHLLTRMFRGDAKNKALG